MLMIPKALVERLSYVVLKAPSLGISGEELVYLIQQMKSLPAIGGEVTKVDKKETTKSVKKEKVKREPVKKEVKKAVKTQKKRK